MVQMKVPRGNPNIALYASFISHMVQMKEAQKDSDTEKQSTLYPTWFR